MTTPIADFIDNYIKSDMSRLHMPGHKGVKDACDITEIKGADSLYNADGIIALSEQNATAVFDSFHTYYSTEGSSQCIKAMLYLAVANRKDKTSRPLVVAARNVHKAFISAAALVDFDVKWILPKSTTSICSCDITPKVLEKTLKECDKKPCAVYITSPDYLGNIADVKALKQVCKDFSVPLIVDNAHGAYLKFTGQHPIDLGADMCCDSAHKTLPVLTGGAYLHINNKAFLKNSKEALCLFGSSSPSYLTLSSLDKANSYLTDEFEKDLEKTIKKVKQLKVYITDISQEPLKITIDCFAYGTTGIKLAEAFRKNKVECEYCDERVVVLMFSPFNTDKDFERIKQVIKNLIRVKTPKDDSFAFPCVNSKMTIREAYFSAQEEVSIRKCENRICGFTTVSCPPAIPIAIAGEVITKQHIELFKKYGVNRIKVIINREQK